MKKKAHSFHFYKFLMTDVRVKAFYKYLLAQPAFAALFSLSNRAFIYQFKGISYNCSYFHKYLTNFHCIFHSNIKQ